jgi:protein-disulfide isomerase
MKNPWVIIGIITVVLIGGAVWYSSHSVTQSNEGVVAGTKHIKGSPEATVQLVEYSDFQCPACAAFQPVINDVLETFGDQMSFEYKHFPLTAIHPVAEPAARAAEAAGQQGKFFEFHDKLFENQETWSRSPNPTAFFMRYAEEVGIDVNQFRRQLRSSILRDEVRADATEARSLELTGTPTFFLNGQRMQIETYQDFFDQIARAIDPTYGQATGTEAVAPAAEPVRFGI